MPLNHSVGVGNNNWKGGRSMRDGYPLVRMPDHHRAGANGYVREHILIAERALGKPLLATHPVHHVDDDRANNDRSNLVVCEDQAYHMLLHRRQRAMDACGDPNAYGCGFCSGYDRQWDIHVYHGRRGIQSWHRSCMAAAKRAQERRRKLGFDAAKQERVA